MFSLIITTSIRFPYLLKVWKVQVDLLSLNHSHQVLVFSWIYYSTRSIGKRTLSLSKPLYYTGKFVTDSLGCTHGTYLSGPCPLMLSFVCITCLLVNQTKALILWSAWIVQMVLEKDNFSLDGFNCQWLLSSQGKDPFT